MINSFSADRTDLTAKRRFGTGMASPRPNASHHFESARAAAETVSSKITVCSGQGKTCILTALKVGTHVSTFGALEAESAASPAHKFLCMVKDWGRYLGSRMHHRKATWENLIEPQNAREHPWEFAEPLPFAACRKVSSWESAFFRFLHYKHDPLLVSCIVSLVEEKPHNDLLRSRVLRWVLARASTSSRTSQFGEFLGMLCHTNLFDDAMDVWTNTQGNVVSALIEAFTRSLGNAGQDKRQKCSEANPTDLLWKGALFGTAVRLVFDCRDDSSGIKTERGLRRWTHRLAHQLGCIVSYTDSVDIHAFLIQVADRKTIYLHNELKTADSCRYICHELAHEILDHTPNSAYGVDSSGLTDAERVRFSTQEVHADYLAESIMTILMALHPQTSSWLKKLPERGLPARESRIQYGQTSHRS